MKFTAVRVALLALVVASVALAAPTRAAEAAGCEAAGGLKFVCGPSAAEDIVRVEGTRWLIASGLAEGKVAGRLHLIDSVNKTWETAFPGPGLRIAANRQRFPQCTTPPDEAVFSAHGIAIHRTGHTQHSLLVINHGREAIEYFTVESRGAKPQLTWVGCVPMPPDVSLNSVVHLPDGGFLTTQFYAPSRGGMEAIMAGKLTGGVLEWHPGGKVTPIDGTDLSGANGLEIADGGRVLYVAAWGSHQIVRFDRRGKRLKKDVVKVDFSPDNLRWSADHTQLLAAGQIFHTDGKSPGTLEGWSIVRLAPATLAITPLFTADGKQPLQGVSVALEVDGLLWVGPFRGDRVGYLPLPH